MRRAIVVGVLALAAGTAAGSFLVELDGGDRMTVDSYWEEGDRIHLMRDGVDLNVARARVRSLRKVDDPAPVAVPALPTPAPDPALSDASDATPAERREALEARQAAIERHLLRVQQQRFEAGARGEPEEAMKRLDREFRRTQTRRHDVIREIESLGRED